MWFYDAVGNVDDEELCDAKACVFQSHLADEVASSILLGARLRESP